MCLKPSPGKTPRKFLNGLTSSYSTSWQISKSRLKGAAKEMYESMTQQQIRDFAKKKK